MWGDRGVNKPYFGHRFAVYMSIKSSRCTPHTCQLYLKFGK